MKTLKIKSFWQVWPKLRRLRDATMQWIQDYNYWEDTDTYMNMEWKGY